MTNATRWDMVRWVLTHPIFAIKWALKFGARAVTSR